MFKAIFEDFLSVFELILSLFKSDSKNSKSNHNFYKEYLDNISTDVKSDISVSVIPPDKWYRRTLYMFNQDHHLMGHLIPAGFKTDGASVPRVAAVISYLLVLVFAYLGNVPMTLLFAFIPVAMLYFPPVGRYFMAASLHDCLLMTGKGWRVSNREFDRAMKHLDITFVRRSIMLTFVRLWGWYRVTFCGAKA